MNSVVKHIYPPSAQTSALTATMGAVGMLLAAHPVSVRYPMGYMNAWVRQPVVMNQVKVFYNPMGNPTGFMTWAWLSSATAQRWRENPRMVLHPSEWHEGRVGCELFVVDFMALAGFARVMVDYAQEVLFPDVAWATNIRRGADGGVRRFGVWRR